MASKAEIVKMITAIETSCENAFNYKTDEQYDVLTGLWYDCFKDYPKEVMWQAVKQAVMHSEYAKQNWIGAVNKELQTLIATPEKNDLQLWNELDGTLYTVYDTSRYLQYSQHYEEASCCLNKIYDGLSGDIKLYVVNVSELIRLSELKYGEDDGTAFNIERQSFLKRLPDLRTHRTKRAQAEQFMRLIGDNFGNLMLPKI